jgi:hypothetical protein
VLFKRAFDSIHVIALSIRHHGNYSVIATSCVAKKLIWNAGHHLTNAELTHRPSPEFSTNRRPPVLPAGSLSRHCDKRKENNGLFGGERGDGDYQFASSVMPRLRTCARVHVSRSVARELDVSDRR